MNSKLFGWQFDMADLPFHMLMGDLVLALFCIYPMKFLNTQLMHELNDSAPLEPAPTQSTTNGNNFVLVISYIYLNSHFD